MPRESRLSAAERAYRESVLRQVQERVRLDGVHVAKAHPDRARQFMPFAALKGYHELAWSKERVDEPRREVTEERAEALSRVLLGLRRGDVVRVVHYDRGAYVETVGAVSEVVNTYRLIRVVRTPILFEDIWSIERV